MKKKSRFFTIAVLLLAVVLIVLYRNGKSNFNSVALDAFTAIEEGDVDTFYALMDIDQSNPLLTKEQFLSTFESFSLGEDYEIEKINALTYKADDVVITLTPDESRVSVTPFTSESKKILLQLGTFLKINDAVIEKNETSGCFNEFVIPEYFRKGSYTATIYGDHIDEFSLSLKDISSGDFSKLLHLTEDAEEDVLERAENFIKSFYYSAQKSLQFDEVKTEYIFSKLEENDEQELESLYLDIRRLFSENNENQISDLLFNDVIKSLGIDDVYFVNLTLSYSYQYQIPDGEIEYRFDDLSATVKFVRENDKWVVISLETEKLI